MFNQNKNSNLSFIDIKTGLIGVGMVTIEEGMSVPLLDKGKFNICLVIYLYINKNCLGPECTCRTSLIEIRRLVCKST